MVLNIILDIILLAVIAGGVALGIKMGFVKVVTKPLRSVLTLAIAFTSATPIGNTLIAPLISKPIINKISSFLYENYAHITAENTDELPTFIKIVAGLMNIDLSEFGENANDIIESIVESLAMPIVNIISALIAFVILLILLKIVLKIVFSLIDAVFQKGVLGVLNKALGSVVCACLAIFAAWALVLIFEYIMHLSSAAEAPIFSKFTGGFIYAFFKQYNPVELLLSF